MAKVILQYTFLFDPSQAWSHLNQFENDLADFFAAQGLEANVIPSVKGQNGVRIMELSKIDFVSRATNNNAEGKSKTMEQIKQVQSAAPTKTFKQYIKPTSQQNNNPKLQFKNNSDLRKRVHKLPQVNFRKVK